MTDTDSPRRRQQHSYRDCNRYNVSNPPNGDLYKQQQFDRWLLRHNSFAGLEGVADF